MGYRYYKRKREDKKIEAIVYLIFLALFVMYYYRETIIKALNIIFGLAFVIAILYLIFKPKSTNIFTQEVRDSDIKIVVTEEDHVTRKNENNIKVHEPLNTQSIQNSLHVNENIQSMEKTFFSQMANKKPSYQERKKRGNDYEIHVGKYYETQGYKVIYNGLINGKKDDGIDLLADNEHETLLIQCKGWQTAEIKQKHLKEFIGNCTTYLEDNPHLKEKNTKRVFITSSENSERGLDKYLTQHIGKIEYIIMPF